MDITIHHIMSWAKCKIRSMPKLLEEGSGHCRGQRGAWRRAGRRQEGGSGYCNKGKKTAFLVVIKFQEQWWMTDLFIDYWKESSVLCAPEGQDDYVGYQTQAAQAGHSMSSFPVSIKVLLLQTFLIIIHISVRFSYHRFLVTMLSWCP